MDGAKLKRGERKFDFLCSALHSLALFKCKGDEVMAGEFHVTRLKVTLLKSTYFWSSFPANLSVFAKHTSFCTYPKTQVTTA